jgi:hypothetical protein
MSVKWQLIETRIDGKSWINKSIGLVVIESTHKELDGKMWLHVSLSRKSKMPTYEDMKLVKDYFIGKDKTAYQVFAKQSEHINLHNFCLHLWHCIDGDQLPDFTNGSGSI